MGGETLENQQPMILHLRWAMHNEKPLPEELQRRAQVSYYGLVTFLDNQVGRILSTLDETE